MSGTLSSSRDQKLAVPETRPLPAPGSLDSLSRTENDELRTALATRIVIERAKGILAERFNMHVDEAFERLRGPEPTNHAARTCDSAHRSEAWTEDIFCAGEPNLAARSRPREIFGL